MPDEQSRFAAVSACAHKPHILSCLFGSAGRQARYFNSEANGMLEYLRIRDLALIEDMELEFGPGINALTGETGAGKSFIVKLSAFCWAISSAWIWYDRAASAPRWKLCLPDPTEI